jgi:predicted metal-dependent phosphoesterase TrpH/energy-coupling factor transporter ATP-binding protein EcfA2
MANTNDLLKAFDRLQQQEAGTGFYKADLHFHTPASEDARGNNKYNFNPYNVPYPVKLKNSEYYSQLKKIQNDLLQGAQKVAADIVQRFLATGLSVVAVTDHNGIGTIWSDPESDLGLMDLAAPTWYEIIDDQAQTVNAATGKTELLILPGVEISTTGVHILAIFSPQNPRRKVHFMICDLLSEIGFNVEDWGKNPRVGKASVQDAIELIKKKGGLPIPAHIDGSDQAMLSLYNLTSGAMKNVLQSEDLRAVEIVDPANFNKMDKTLKKSIKAWMDDLRRENGLPSLAYFQGSDAHDLPSISKRLTYLKMTKPSYSGLNTAVKMPSSRVRIAASYKEFEGLCLHSMAFKHPFLGLQELRFNRNLNCITGKRGSGKTSLFTLMQNAVDPARPQKDSDAVLFVEQVKAGVSSYYAFCRNVGQATVDVYTIDPANRVVTPVDAARVQSESLQPKFYDPAAVEEMIIDQEKLRSFLKASFGDPTPENIKKFNDHFATPRFLDQQQDPLLALSEDGTGYRLAANVQWRSGQPAMKDFFNLSLSLRRTALICINIMNSGSGPVIIDAPEEQFDNDDMMRYLVPIIREYKDRCQILLFTSHPILAVNTDPDNYFILRMQGTSLQDIVSGFAVDAQEQRPLLLNILEGGLEAIRKRANLYDLC